MFFSISFLGVVSIFFGSNAQASFESSDFLVTDLAEIEEAFGAFDGQMYAGLLPTEESEEEDSKLMFWLFEPFELSAPDTLTIWLNGGPGCSSFAGALFENSPVTTPHYPAGYPKTKADEPLIANEWSWTKATNMLFVEQPVGTGFSFGPTPTSEADVAQDFYGFLMNFYKTFPQMKDKKLYIFGESYAGMYVPSIAREIHLQNKKMAKDDGNRVSLTGIGLGNAWMDAKIQGPMVIDYAWWHGLIDSVTRDALKAVWIDCRDGLKEMSAPYHDFTVPDECSIMGSVLAAAGAGAFPPDTYRSPNTYDVTTFDLYPVLFNPNSTYYSFFNNINVKKAIHAPTDEEWLGCIPGAGRRRSKRRRNLEEEKENTNNNELQLPGQLYLAHDRPESVIPYVAELLDEANIRVIVYNGDRDLSTCAQGSETMLDEMKWDGADGWKNSSTYKRGLWMVNNEVAGFAKSYKNLDFVVVYNSGHLVPNNVPIPALDLITRFVTNKEYTDVDLPKFNTPKNKNSNKTQQDAQYHGYSNKAITIAVIVAVVVGFFLGNYIGARNTRKKLYSSIDN